MSSITLPGFQVLDTLHQTSKTITVKAVQNSLDRTVAIIVLRPELAANPNEVRRFLGIARVCAQIKADGLPQIYDITSHSEQPYIVMEYVEGQSVADLVRQNGPMPAMRAVRIVQTVAEALDHAWRQSRLVHRNLKPSEIRIDNRGTPKLTDFGRATMILPDGQVTDGEDPGIVVGTPNFLSPEQARGNTAIDCRADIYALGATLYYMITGRVPFPDSDPETVLQKQVTDQIPHPRTFRPDLPASISGLLNRLMMKNLEDRYADWTEAMGDMQLALKNQPLRRRETPLKGISTIAAMGALSDATPPPELPQLRKVAPAGSSAPASSTGTPANRRAQPAGTITPDSAAAFGPASAAKGRSSRDSVLSQFVRIVLCLLLVIWLVLLGNDRVGNPLSLSLPSPLLPLDEWFGTAPANHPSATPPPPAASPSPSVIAPPLSPAVVTPPPVTNAPDVPAVVPPPPVKPVVVEKPPEPEKPRLPQTLPADINRQLADAFTHGNLAGARGLLAANIAIDPARLAEFRNAVAAIPDPLRLAEETLLASKGQEIAVSYLGRERKIIPRSAANGDIEADYVSADGNRPVTFKTSKFTPEELLKLLPQQPETPAVHSAVCITLLQANRKADIAAHVPYCGVLGPVFEAAAAAAP